MASLLPLTVINTVHWRRSDDPTDELTSYDSVLTVIRDSGLLPDLEPLRQASSDDPEGARQAVEELIRWRELVYKVVRRARREASGLGVAPAGVEPARGRGACAPGTRATG